MFNLSSLLISYGPQFEEHVKNKKVKLARHAIKQKKEPDYLSFDDLLKFDSDLLRIFTADQGFNQFNENDLILSFVPTESTRSLFRGAFLCKGRLSYNQFKMLYPNHSAYSALKKRQGMPDIAKSGYLYHLEECTELNELNNRLVIDWGSSTQKWVQSKLDKKIWEIRPEGFVSDFPGWDDVFISHHQLKAIISNPEGNKDWFHFLTQHGGVYVILDTKTGKKYVGSACSDKGPSPGFWSRWSGYAKTGHNYNKALLELIEHDPRHSDYFMYSIHHVFPKGSKTAKEVRYYESRLKEKLGTRGIFGLNSN